MPYLLRDAYGRDYPVWGTLQIGRDPSNTLPLQDPNASRLHATVWEAQGALYLRDENSSNGTYVNGARVQQVALRPGDQIAIGSAVFTVALAQPPQTAPASPRLAIPATARPPAPPGPAWPATPATARPASPPAPARPAKKRPGCLFWLVAGCGALVLGLAILAGGGYLAFRAGLITTDTLLNLVGLGPADLEIDNFRDDTIQVSILQLDVPAEETPTQASLEVGDFDVRTYQFSEPGRYQIDFATSYGSADLGTCTLTVRSGDIYQFVTLPDKIVINRVDDPAETGSDLLVSTSSFCR